MNKSLAILKGNYNKIESILLFLTTVPFNFPLRKDKITKLLYQDKTDYFVTLVNKVINNKSNLDTLYKFFLSLDKNSYEVYYNILIRNCNKSLYNYIRKTYNFPKPFTLKYKKLDYPYTNFYVNNKQFCYVIKYKDFIYMYQKGKGFITDFDLTSLKYINKDFVLFGTYTKNKFYLYSINQDVLAGLKFYCQYKNKLKNFKLPEQEFIKNDKTIITDKKYIISYKKNNVNITKNLSLV